MNGKDSFGKEYSCRVLEASLLSILDLDIPPSDNGGFELSASKLREFIEFNSPEAFSGLLLVERIFFPSFLTSENGLWVLGSITFCKSFFVMDEFHRFFISLSVLPGNCAAIRDHLIEVHFP